MHGTSKRVWASHPGQETWARPRETEYEPIPPHSSTAGFPWDGPSDRAELVAALSMEMVGP